MTCHTHQPPRTHLQFLHLLQSYNHLALRAWMIETISQEENWKSWSSSVIFRNSAMSGKESRCVLANEISDPSISWHQRQGTWAQFSEIQQMNFFFLTILERGILMHSVVVFRLHKHVNYNSSVNAIPLTNGPVKYVYSCTELSWKCKTLISPGNTILECLRQWCRNYLTAVFWRCFPCRRGYLIRVMPTEFTSVKLVVSLL